MLHLNLVFFSDLTYSGIPPTKLGTYLENRVNNFLKNKDAGAGDVTIKVLSSGDKVVEVKPGMKARWVWWYKNLSWVKKNSEAFKFEKIQFSEKFPVCGHKAITVCKKASDCKLKFGIKFTMMYANPSMYELWSMSRYSVGSVTMGKCKRLSSTGQKPCLLLRKLMELMCVSLVCMYKSMDLTVPSPITGKKYERNMGRKGETTYSLSFCCYMWKFVFLISLLILISGGFTYHISIVSISFNLDM